MGKLNCRYDEKGAYIGNLNVNASVHNVKKIHVEKWHPIQGDVIVSHIRIVTDEGIFEIACFKRQKEHAG